MDIAEFENGLQTQAENINKIIESSGYCLCGNGNYTVGLSLYGLPEFFIENDTFDDIKSICDTIVTAIVEDGLKVDGNSDLSSVVGFPVSLSLVSDNEKRKIAHAARVYYGHWNFDMFRIHVRH